MDYTTLGATGLKVSVAGLGCGGNSRVGLGRGASFDECVDIVRTAIDLGVNFLDTAENYGTEEIVGAAARHYDRDKLVISTKAILKGGDATPTAIGERIDASLRRLGLETIDVFHLHAVAPADYAQARDVLAPALVEARDAGKIRFIGITETSPNDPDQRMLREAICEPPWEVIMLAYSLMHQNARRHVFPITQERGIGTLLMFVVRNFFSRPENRRQALAQLVETGKLPAEFAAEGDPFAFLMKEGGAENLTDAAYRFARHQPGADVILFGTGNKAHVRANVESILRPPLAPEVVAKVHEMFGHLSGVGLDLPDHVMAKKAGGP